MYKEDLALKNNKGWYAIKLNQTKHIYLIYMYKEDLALNNPEWLICFKTKQPQNHMYIWYICIKRIWLQITYSSWYAIKQNKAKSYIFNIYVYRGFGIK